MASRQEEKQRRREERLARERAEAAAAARRKRLQWAGGGVLVVALVAAVVVFVAAGAGGSSGGGVGKATDISAAAAKVRLPQQQTSDVFAAAKAAGCVLQHPPIEGRTHVTRKLTEKDYKTNPPTSGNHNPVYYQDGIYNAGDVPNLGMLVHPLEHGRIELQYEPGTPKPVVTQLEALFQESSQGYHMLLFENTTGMKYQVAATAWGQLLGCPQMNSKVFDAVRTFRERYIDKGPEVVP
ncbi:MAG TPA: DUF3105 domain-containing protein [Solirubrobacteraceae bacterium]|jgi:hypothetical protein|nr:DUF3105 domain-containing protein [Solirubrobacteraceae bacterium]